MDDVVKIIELSGFDPNGDPDVRVMRNGDMYVVFNFMPPSWADESAGLGNFSAFAQEMSAAIGRPVLRDDREVFLIRAPQIDTLPLLRQFIATYRENAEKKKGDQILGPERSCQELLLCMQQLEQFLKPHGFALKAYPTSWDLRRRIAGGWQQISALYAKITGELHVSVDIRLNQVEKIANEFHWYESSEEVFDNTATSMTYIGYFSDRSDIGYEAATLTQIHYILGHLQPLLMEKVLPFLERCHDIPSLEAKFNGKSAVKFDLQPQMPEQAYRALVLARLANNPKFEEMVQGYQPALSVWGQNEHDCWNRLIAHLRAHKSS